MNVLHVEYRDRPIHKRRVHDIAFMDWEQLTTNIRYYRKLSRVGAIFDLHFRVEVYDDEEDNYNLYG